ncbi:hypothetical protein AMECASPLE_030549 [Ameca splendens]|uniref:Uncharacterized protein n=1 Tax=Ameca splendens TaxID=208324 RepID=A0ABV0XJ17_9TELE
MCESVCVRVRLRGSAPGLICQTSPGYRSYRRRTAWRATLTLTQNNTYRPTASPRDVDPTLSWELGHEAETKREKKKVCRVRPGCCRKCVKGRAGLLPPGSPEVQPSSRPLLLSLVPFKNRLTVRLPTKLLSLISVLLSSRSVRMSFSDCVWVCVYVCGVEITKKETDLFCKTRTERTDTSGRSHVTGRTSSASTRLCDPYLLTSS